MTQIPTVGIADEYGWNIPIESMYGIYANIGSILMVNVTIYSIQGSYGIWKERMVQHDSTRLKQRSSTRNRPGTTRPPGGLVSSWANLFSALPQMVLCSTPGSRLLPSLPPLFGPQKQRSHHHKSSANAMPAVKALFYHGQSEIPDKKSKMQPTNPNAHTYVNDTDVETHGYAVTQNTYLQ